MITHFKPSLKTLLIVAVGSIGLSFILTQRQTKNIELSQCVICGCERFYFYALILRSYQIINIWKSCIIIQTVTMYLTVRLRLQSYSLTIRCIPGQLNPVDVLSVNLLEIDEDARNNNSLEGYHYHLIAFIIPKPLFDQKFFNIL